MTGMVIIGGGMAAARACINLRADGYEGKITLIMREALLPYDRPPLSKSSITDDAEPKPHWLLEPDMVASLKVDIHQGLEARKIDRAAKQVVLANGQVISYSKLLLATGANPRTLPHALVLRSYEDAHALRAHFVGARKIVIIGGGFIGLEVAASAVARGCKVTLIEAQPRILMRGVPEKIAQIIHARHVAAGVDMRVGEGVADIRPASVLLKSGVEIAADVIIAGIGASPEVALAQEAGITIDNGIACNANLQTSDPDIYAAGDCCSFIHEGFGGKRIRLEAWRSAQEQAATAAANMVGGSLIHKSIPWFWSDQYDLGLQITGMAELGPKHVVRELGPQSLLLFHLSDDGRLMGASGIGIGNAVARDIKLAEMLIAKGAKPDPTALADAAVQLKSLLKA